MNTQQQPIDTWTREQCEEYLGKYPHSLNSEAVRKRFESFRSEIERETKKKEADEERAFWKSHNYTTEGIIEYMKKYPKGRFLGVCDDTFWRLSNSSIQDVEEYKRRFTKGKHVEEANKKKAELVEQRKQRVAQREVQKSNEKAIKKIVKGVGLLLCSAAAIVIITVTIDQGFWGMLFALGPVGWIGSKIMNWKID